MSGEGDLVILLPCGDFSSAGLAHSLGGGSNTLVLEPKVALIALGFTRITIDVCSLR